MKGGFNLSDWALRHQSLVWYLMAVSLVMGVFSYLNLGREEDPSFAIKTMVIQTRWPGATVDDTLEQVTDRIEKKLEELDSLDYVKSYTRPGESTVFVYLKDTTKAGDIPDIWYQVRKKISDIQGEFPQGIQGPGFNDEFGDVFGSVYAFTADGLDFRQLRDYVEKVRLDIRSVKDLGKVQMIGAQNEVIYLNFSTRKLAALGLDQRQVVQSLQAQNAVTPSGVVEAGPERISVRTSGNFRSEKDLQAVNLRVNDRFYRLSDLASISRDFVDPPTSLFRYKGEPAIGLAVAMKEGGNILEFGEALNARMQEITGELPVGVGVHQVSNQAQVVKKAVGGFTRALFEAVVIVLIVSFVSLGLRAGLVVACSIPLVLAMVFVFMEYTDITMQRVSLGALIIALGLLVDDAMITVEMMITRLELGDSLHDSATYAYTSTAFPMLTGTLVTVAGFVPIGLNASSAGEYTFTLFAVIAVALLLSWIVAVLFAPVIAVHILPKTLKHKSEQKKGRIAERFDSLLHLAMRRRWTTIFLTALLFGVSLFLMKFVQHQFFPSSDRPELLVDLNLPQNSSIHETRAVMDRLEATLKDDEDIDHWSAYVGEGAIRLPAAGPAVAEQLLWPAGDRHQGPGGPRARRRAPARSLAQGLRRHQHLRAAAGDGAAGGTADPVPGQRTADRQGPRVRHGPGRRARRQPEHRRYRLRLERAREDAQDRHRPGQGAPARAFLRGRGADHEQRGDRQRGDPGARRHLPGERHRPRRG